MSGHSMLRSGCGCLVSIVLIIVGLVVGLIEMSAPSTPSRLPRPTPTVPRSGALPSLGLPGRASAARLVICRDCSA